MHRSVMPRVVSHRNSLPIVVTLHNLNSVRHPILAYLSLALFVGCFPFSSCPIRSLSPLPFPPSTFSISRCHSRSLHFSHSPPSPSSRFSTIVVLQPLFCPLHNLFLVFFYIPFYYWDVIPSSTCLPPLSHLRFLSQLQFHFCSLVPPSPSFSSSTSSKTPVPPPPLI